MAGTQYFTEPGDTAPIPRVGSPTSESARAPHRRVRPWDGRHGSLLKAGGLVLVAVIAGMVWWVIRHEPVQPVAQPQPVQQREQQKPDALTAGTFDYSVTAGPVVTENCVPHSYGRIHDWFGDHPCERLARGLYTTTTQGGARALVSVSVVRMPSHEDATNLYDMAFSNGTGNVSDLVRDGADVPSDAPKVSGGQYKSKVVGSRVTIVEANFFGDVDNDKVLSHIAADARRLSELLT